MLLLAGLLGKGANWFWCSTASLQLLLARSKNISPF
jgi:hypothetical protein